MDRLKRTKTEIEQAVIDIEKYDLSFTEDERKLLREELRKKYDSESVEHFIDTLETLCNIRNNIPNGEQISYLRDKMNLDKMLNSFKNTLKFLKYLESGKLLMPSPGTVIVDDVQEKLWEFYLFGQDISYIAEKSAKSLKQLIKMIEDSPIAAKRTQGRPRADDNRFVTSIVHIFYEIFQEIPTKYADGPFFETLRITFEAMGLPGKKDPSRAVRSALEKIQY